MARVKTYKSPLRFVGGKGKLADMILGFVPKDHLAYAEPFCGGCGVLFKKPKSKVEMLNDYDGNLVNFWQQVRDHYDELIETFKYVPVSREVFNQYKTQYLENTYDNDLQRAHIYCYLNLVGFGGNMRQPVFAAEKYGRSPCDYKFIANRIEQAWERLQAVYVEHLDFSEVIPKWDAPSTFFYIDPPYRGTKQYATGKFTDDQYEQLHDCCKKLKGRFLITLNDDLFFRELFSDFNIVDHEVVYSICRDDSGRRKFRELLIMNYDLNIVKE